MKAFRFTIFISIITTFVWGGYGSIVQFQSNVDEEQWWKSASLYQIYPRSFQDSNGDGIGDLKGITSRLGHLKELNIKAFWLNPIFESPLKDFGYDISDFYAIHSDYGSMEDFDNLVKEANKMGIGVILDFVPNHTSNESVWFQKSINEEEPYTDYYVWHDGKRDENGKPIPPNNWTSVFDGIAWTWNDKREQYYLHQFLPEQPDLNYRNPKVVEEMKNVFLFWLGKGLAGFRIDATNHLFEDSQFRDEPLSGYGEPDDYGYLEHIYTKDQPECYEMIYDWRKILDDFAVKENTTKKILITEAFASIDDTMRYYVSENGTLGSHFPYNAQLLYLYKDISAEGIKNNVDYWMSHMPEGHVADWPIGSHDHSRPGTRVGPYFIGIMNMLNMLLPGASITYYGEEIGMEDNLKYANSKENRDMFRTPMQWDSSVSSGFSTNASSWLSVLENYKTVNVENMKNLSRSHYHHYKELVELRKLPTFMYGNLTMKAIDKNIFAFTRTYPEHPTCLVAVNLGRTAVDVPLKDFPDLSDTLTVKSSVEKSKYRINDTVAIDEFHLDGYDGVVVCGAPKLFQITFLLIISISISISFLF